jgi:FKBP12-rapamycin complex-associated protein
LLNTGNFMSMNSRFKDVCDTILKYRDHKERIIRRTVINLLPRLAAFAPEEFAAKYLDVCMQALLGVLKKDGRGEERASAFLVLGQIAHSVGPGIEPYRPQLTALIKNALDVRNRGYCLQSLTCWSMVSSALGAAVQQDMPEMLGMCVCGGACACQETKELGKYQT